MKMASLLFLAGFSLNAWAQEQSFLSKADIEALANGKKWTHVRVGDGRKIRWDLRNGGQLLANNLSANSSDSGTWFINDMGQLCVKWRGKSIDRCVAVLKEGESLKMIDSNDLKGVYAELNVE